MPLVPPLTLTLAGVPETRTTPPPPPPPGPVTISKGKGFRGPGIPADSAIGLQCETALAAIGGKNNDAAACAAAASGIVCSTVVCEMPLAVKSRSATESESANDNDAAAGRAAAGLIIAIGIISRSGTTAAAHGNAINGCRKSCSALAA